MEKLQKITVEWYAKICVDALNGDPNNVTVPWNIHTDTLCNDAKLLRHYFISCSFVWVNREPNLIAHALAKFDAHQIPFNNLATAQDLDSKTSLPPSIKGLVERCSC